MPRNSRAPFLWNPRTRPWSVRTTSGSGPAAWPEAAAPPAVSPDSVTASPTAASMNRPVRLIGNRALCMADLIFRSQVPGSPAGPELRRPAGPASLGDGYLPVSSLSLRHRSGQGTAVVAQVAYDADLAAWPLCPADGPPVGDQRDVQVVPDRRGHARRENLMRLVRARVRRHPAKPDRDPVDVGVDREGGPAHREHKHARGRLGPHAGQRKKIGFDRRVIKIVQTAEVEPALSFLNGRENLLDTARLLVRDPPAADGAGDLVRVCVRNLFPVREPVFELCERPF